MDRPMKLIAMLPSELVDDLERDGVVDRLPVVRSGGPIEPDLIVTSIQVAATLVTLSQIPQTFSYLAAAISRWRKDAASDEVTLSVVARGPRGRVTMELDRVTTVPEIEGILKLVDEGPDD
jgi:hypothetical protein